ncbi:alpha/beta fold hydrolase [Saccharopolyspora griseoalba]|uniref:Alpha/beta fold hydrolase n=1 Tax=Saccharopolyspora griseoalba TaxID=1431848 RepID=A0ABW2LIK4_9PSEU
MEGPVFAASSSPAPDVSAVGTRSGAEFEHGASADRAVLMCPELVSAAELLPVDCPARVLNWSPQRNSTIDEHVADAVAALDAAELPDCVVTAWSGGTAVAVELARRHPDRIRGLLLLAGPPTAGAELLLECCGVPPLARRALAAGGGAWLRAAGGALRSATARVPVPQLTARLLARTGLLPEGEATAAALGGLIQHDWLGHLEMALAWSAATRPGPAGLTCPVTLLAGRYDPLAEPRGLASAIGSLPQARIRFLDTGHLVPLEAPQEVRAELDLLLRRARAVDCARLGLEPPPPAIPRIRIPVSPGRQQRRRTLHPPE